MHELHPACELALASLTIVAVILLTRGAHPDAPPATAAELRHDPRACSLCRHPTGRVKPMPLPESELVSPPLHPPLRARPAG